MFELLSSSRFGEALGEEVCRSLAASGSLVHYKADDIVFHENDPAHAVFIVLAGVVKLVRYGEDGRETIIHPAEPVHMFAEAGLFLERYPVTAVASKPTDLLRIERETVLRLMEQHPVLLRRIFDTMANWLRRLVDTIDQLTLNDATARVANYLLRERATRLDEGGNPDRFVIPLKKGEAARMLNMNQATFSRALRMLQDDGTLHVQARNLLIRNLEQLKQHGLPPLDE
ncbi:cyclic nucleotide-binding domain-containing protein [bacterium]|nr:cyclic nucleotide-binding domain-containing protein [bacterium]